MTTFKARRLTLALVLPLLLLAVGCDSQTVIESGPFTIRFDQPVTVENTASGVFEASGMIEDAGRFEEDVTWIGPSDARPWAIAKSGFKTLSSEKGTIKIEFYFELPPYADPELNRFTIIEGTGHYTDLEGEGKVDLLAAEKTEVYKGTARYQH